MTAYIWIGGSTNNWADPNNWTPAGYPNTAGDTALIDATGTYTVSVASGETDALAALTLNASGATLSVDGTLAFAGTNSLAISAGTLAMGSSGTISGNPDLTIGAAGTLDVTASSQTVGSLSGSGLILLGTNSLTTGGDNANTTFSGTVQGGGVDEGALVQNGTGTLTLLNATMTNNELIMGSGNLAVTTGISQIFYLAVGESGGHSGTATISGGILNIGGASATLKSALQVGDFGGTGLLTQTGGAVNVTGSFNIGNQGGNGTYNLQGGTLTLLNGSYDIGRDANDVTGTGTLNISGGELDIATGALVLGNWYPNDGIHESSGKIVQTAGTIDVEGSSQIFLAALGNGEYDLDGGTLEVGGNGLRSQFNGSGTGVLHWGGGAIQVTGSNLTTDANIVLDAATSSTLTLGTLNAGFSGSITGAGTLVIGGSGTATFSALGGTGTIGIGAGSTLTVSGAVGAGQTLDFQGTAGKLSLGDPTGFAGTIAGFDSTDTIDLTGISYDSAGSANLDGSTDLLTIVENGTSYVLQLTGDYTDEYFKLADDTAGGTAVTEDGTPCYCRGTMILTDRGEIAVENLRIGDRLITASGKARPLRWIGMRSYSGRFAAGNKDVLPVQIKQGALSDTVPKRDLWVSPLHAMYLADMLVPVGVLTNGVSIVQASRVDRVDYFHLELETHDVILAEGALSETFLDDDRRAMFSNAASYREIYPQAVKMPPLYCAPRLEDGDAVQAIRDAIAARICRFAATG